MIHARYRAIAALFAIATVAVPLYHRAAVAREVGSVAPAVTVGYYNALPGFDILVSGQHFTPSSHADVLVLELGGVRARNIVTVTAQGAFTDKTHLPCDFHAQAVTAFDQPSGQWSNQAILSGSCPG